MQEPWRRGHGVVWDGVSRRVVLRLAHGDRMVLRRHRPPSQDCARSACGEHGEDDQSDPSPAVAAPAALRRDRRQDLERHGTRG